MVSNKELEQVVSQVNSSYAALVERIAKLEAEVEALSTLKAKSKDK